MNKITTFCFLPKWRKPIALMLLLSVSLLSSSFLTKGLVAPNPAASYNTEPVALFTASALSGNGSLNVIFDATTAYDLDLDNLSYAWDFGDGHTGLGINISHTYIAPGTYDVTLTVNDGQSSGQKTVSIIVHENATDNAKITFSDATNLLSGANYSGVTMSVVDMNGDGKDDIVRYNDAKSLNIQYQQGINQAFTSVRFGTVSELNQWSNTVADVNQDGFNDILTGGLYDGIKILYNNNGQSYDSRVIRNSEIFIQGSNFVDIDNDGWVDVFACYDHGDNREFRNLGDGTFTFSPNMINTETTLISDNSGNYSSIWTDYDNDGDIDLYISKCRSEAESPTDLRRINMLFQNDGNNNFTEVAAAANLNIGAQSWLTDFADIDNDGDMDCIVVNHGSVYNLMQNNGNGTFTDVTNGSGLLPALTGRFGIQAFFRDFNNDGFVDLLVSGEKHYLFYNDGDGTFTQAPNPFNANEIESMAIGDLNHDGFLDVYAGFAKIYNMPSDIQDRLFLNNGNSNNFIAIQLAGVESNINGIGAKVRLFGAWGEQIREVRSGEGYGVMNSFTQHFGIGTATQISKVVVNWPSGTVDEIINPTPNQFLKIEEGNNANSLCATDVVEPNNTFNERTDLGSGDIFNQAVLCITPNDEDYFIFSTDGETYFVRVQGANGTATGEYGLSIERNGNSLNIETQSVNQSTTDTYLYLYDDNLTLLAENDNATTTFSKITYTLPDDTDGGTTLSCGGNTRITYGDGAITMSGQPGQEIFFQVFDLDWKEVYNCGWQCGPTRTVSNLAAGDYRVHIKNSDYQVICEQVITLSTGSNDPDNDSDGVPASLDCNDTDPNLTTIGASCDDGNVGTVNDMVQSNCTCSGTTSSEENSQVITCEDITITYGEGIIDMAGVAGNSYFFKISDLNNNWSQAFNCGWNCGHQQTATNIPNGRYMITINQEDWREYCSVEIEMTNSPFTARPRSPSIPQLNFEAFNAERAVDLQWLTNSGYKIKYFEVEHSLDGVNFKSFQKTINKNWSEELIYHHATDLTPAAGINYYRIKEVYLDNSFTYTEIKQVGFFVDIEELAIYPNPVENVLRLSLKPIMGKKTKINIINAFGQVVQSYDFGIVNNENEQIRLDKVISNGFYHVWIEVAGKKPIIKKMIVKRPY